LLLRYYGNLKFVEIAEMLGCPLNTALGRMHKAMIRLRQVLAEDAPVESRTP
jgi:DNA-directed RNA polymerase specialized sigma24 family protein